MRVDALARAMGPGFSAQDPNFRALVDALPVAIYTTDADGKITYFNEAAAEFWGKRAADRPRRMVRLVEAVLA